MPTTAMVLVLVLGLFLSRVATGLNSDGATLLSFKRSILSDPERSMADWVDSDATPCRWSGVSCDVIRGESEPRLSGLALPKKRLVGSISPDLGSLVYLARLNLRDNQLVGSLPPALFNATALQSIVLSGNDLSGPLPRSIARAATSLQVLDLSNNGFTGTIPAEALGSCTGLQTLLLNSNRLSGTIPLDLGYLVSLSRLDLSGNQLNGSIPDDLGNLASLGGTLNLSHNNLSGAIPASLGQLPINLSIDLSFNNLSGPIPLNGTLSNQGPTAFLGNPGLCGLPLKTKCSASVASPLPFFGPSTRPPGSSSSSPLAKRSGSKLSTLVVVAIAVGDALGILLLMGSLFLAYLYCTRRRKNRGRRRRRRGCCFFSSNSSSSNSDGEDFDVVANELGNGELLHFDAGAAKLFDLDSLLRASAYVLGKGSSGLVYKAVLGSGEVVVVRRLGDGGTTRRSKEFEAEVKSIGSIRHPNVLALRAYYSGMNEKLLIYDHMPNGSLATALQQHQRYVLLQGCESRGLDEQELEEQATCLSWSQRLAIAKGIARGLAYLHDSNRRLNVHGSVKPSNILLDEKMEAYVSDFGVARLTEMMASHDGTNISTSSSMRSVDVPEPTTVTPTATNLNAFSSVLLQLQQEQAQTVGSCSSLSLYSASASIYRPPEAAISSSSSKPTQKWDVYSFGVVLLEMLTGSASAQLASSDVDTMASVGRMLASCSGAGGVNASDESEAMAVVEVATRCLSPSPEQRPRMKQVADALSKIGSV